MGQIWDHGSVDMVINEASWGTGVVAGDGGHSTSRAGYFITFAGSYNMQ